MTGCYRITELEGFDDEYLHLVAEPTFHVAADGTGCFRFGALEATMVVQETEEGADPGIQFEWEGFDEGDRISGRGWAVLRGTSLRGEIVFRFGDTYIFEAERLDK